MAEIILVRHGQANSSARDEAGYDRLSDLGHQQARWLGEHMATTNPHFDHIVCGDMVRHRETAAGIGHTDTDIDARWNDQSYFALSDALEKETGLPHPASDGDFVTHVGQVFDHWQRGVLQNVPETYQAFETRVVAALNDVAERGGRNLVVTSTGVISIVLKHVLDLGHTGHMKVIVQTANTSVHRVEFLHGTFFMAEFGTTPHLDTPERRLKRTHY